MDTQQQVMIMESDMEILVWRLSRDHLVWSPNMSKEKLDEMPYSDHVKPIKMKLSEYSAFRERCKQGLSD